MKATRSELTEATKRLVQAELFSKYAEMENVVSVAIVGSVALDLHDEHSDIDLGFYFDSEASIDRFEKPIIQLKKRRPEAGGLPVQIHRPKLISEVDEELGLWINDGQQRETTEAILIHDPHWQLAELQQRYSWYPDDIYREKVNWLFANLVFEIKERFEVAAKRDDRYFWAVSKLQILRLIGNLILISNHRYPAFDKHLSAAMKPLLSKELAARFDSILTCNNLDDGIVLVNQLRQVIEMELQHKKLIPKESDRYWIDLRPRHRVQLTEM